MSLINSLIIDDSELDRLTVECYVSDYPFLKLEGSLSNPLDCLGFIESKNIQLLFLDIDMPEINGIDFLNSLKNPPLCIFITSHPEFALDGFETHALDFLVKPAHRAIVRKWRSIRSKT